MGPSPGGGESSPPGPGRARPSRAGAEAAVSPAEAVLGEELSELLGAAESRRAPRDEPDVSTGIPRGAARWVSGRPPGRRHSSARAGAPEAYRPSAVHPGLG